MEEIDMDKLVLMNEQLEYICSGDTSVLTEANLAQLIVNGQLDTNI